MVKLRRVRRPGRSYDVWEEVHPELCPGCGEPYRGGHVAVGWLACGCDGAERGAHRTLYCRDCACEVFLPPHHAQHGPEKPPDGASSEEPARTI
jgi:hypothetical protein